MSCGVGCRHGSDPALLWLCHRPAGTALIRPLAWEPPYAAEVALEKTHKTNKQKNHGFKSQSGFRLGLSPGTWVQVPICVLARFRSSALSVSLPPILGKSSQEMSEELPGTDTSKHTTSPSPCSPCDWLRWHLCEQLFLLQKR